MSWNEPRTRVSFSRVLALFVLGLGPMSSCSSTSSPEEPSTQVIPRASEAPFLSPEERALRRKQFENDLRLAIATSQEGRLREALDRTTDALAKGPPSDLRTEFMKLRREVKDAILSDEVVVASCETEHRSYVARAPVAVSITLTNVGPDPMRLPRTHYRKPQRRIKGESESVLRIRILYQDWDHVGSTVAQEKTVTIPLESDVELDPGETWTQTFSLSTDESFFRPDLVVFRRIRLSGTIQAVEIEAGSLRWFAPIPIQAATFDLFPDGIQKVQEDPEGTLKRALEACARTSDALGHVFFSSIVLFDREPAMAARYLIEGLSSSHVPLQRTSLSSLRLLSGRNDLTEIRDWEEWVDLDLE